MDSLSRAEVLSDLTSREEPLILNLDQLHSCAKSEYIGKFPSVRDYDRVINEDCDVFVGGKKVISFRKALLPGLREGSTAQPELWDFFRKASREVYGTQRGVVAGTEFTTKPEYRLTKGQIAFFVQSAAGIVSTLEQAHELLNSSNELTSKTIKVKYIKKDFPEIKKALDILEKKLRGKGLSVSEIHTLGEEKRNTVWSWFPDWLATEWLPSKDKSAVTKEVMNKFISSQLNFNHCYSNVLGAVDRGARFPYGRLSGTTQRNYHFFERYKNIYAAACEGFRYTFPEIWDKVKETIARAKDPVYNLFGTAFTSVTLNFNFKTAYHVDKNNLHGALAVLSVITKGQYEGHYLVFPEVRLAFDLRDGDFIIGDTQTLLHGNTPMTKLTEDAERVSLVFYSRENMIYLDDLECEECRRSFMKHSSKELKSKSKSHKDWRGVWPEMWVSLEWYEFRKERGLERCSNSNWQLSAPYRKLSDGTVKLFKQNPGPEWEHLEVALGQLGASRTNQGRPLSEPTVETVSRASPGLSSAVR